MKHVQPSYIISVDSETGSYWNGQQIVLRTALIKALLEKATTQKSESIAVPFCRDTDHYGRGEIGHKA